MGSRKDGGGSAFGLGVVGAFCGDDSGGVAGSGEAGYSSLRRFERVGGRAGGEEVEERMVVLECGGGAGREKARRRKKKCEVYVEMKCEGEKEEGKKCAYKRAGEGRMKWQDGKSHVYARVCVCVCVCRIRRKKDDKKHAWFSAKGDGRATSKGEVQECMCE